jgi:hypothetical protein
MGSHKHTSMTNLCKIVTFNADSLSFIIARVVNFIFFQSSHFFPLKLGRFSLISLLLSPTSSFFYEGRGVAADKQRICFFAKIEVVSFAFILVSLLRYRTT